MQDPTDDEEMSGEEAIRIERSHVDRGAIAAPDLATVLRARGAASPEPLANLVIAETGALHIGSTAPLKDNVVRICVCCAEDELASDPELAARIDAVESELAFLAGGTAIRPAQADSAGLNEAEVAQLAALVGAIKPVSADTLGGRAVTATLPPLAGRGSRSFVMPEPFTGSPHQMAELRPHIINMTHGRLSQSGIASTSRFDLEAIIDDIEAHCVRGDKTLLFYAHGGLTAEKDALAAAWCYHRWWLENGIYPVFFIWETGALRTLWHVIAGEQAEASIGTRGIFDFTDGIVERIASGVGTHVWNDMKSNARACSDRNGGATEFAKMFNDRLGKGEDAALPRIVAVGHSAGSIFHGHFLKQLASINKQIRIDQLHLLAPAINEEDFKSLLAPLLDAGGTIGEATLFAMNRSTEQADNCGGIYRKSLLYLVRNAFEKNDEVGISGMQESWNDSATFQKYLKAPVWSPTASRWSQTSSQSLALSHGGFDNDPATIESVLRRIRGIEDGQPVPVAFPREQPRAIGFTMATPPNFYGFPESFQSFNRLSPALLGVPAPAVAPVVAPAVTPAATPAPGQPITLGAQRIALCIGNDDFRGQPKLQGCINDAHAWAAALKLQGFETRVEGDCTAAAMRDHVRQLVSRARPGDTLVLQISSHGTQIRDLDGDELRDDQLADVYDEAVIGIDADAGGVIADDEWAGLLAVPAGVHLVRFHDFCSSGRSSRMMLDSSVRVRFARLSAAQEGKAQAQLHLNGARSKVARGSYDESLTSLTYCACQPDKQAYESQGMGAFSRAATTILSGGQTILSAQQLFDAIVAEMDSNLQAPILEGPQHLRAAPAFGS